MPWFKRWTLRVLQTYGGDFHAEWTKRRDRKDFERVERRVMCNPLLCDHGKFTGRNSKKSILLTCGVASERFLKRFLQILFQIQQTAVQSQRALSISRQQIAAKDRERRILQITIDEIGGLEPDVRLYKGVGKM
jgi:Tfp pilus assembly protein PilN